MLCCKGGNTFFFYAKVVCSSYYDLKNSSFYNRQVIHVKNLLYFAGVLQMMQTRIGALQSTVDRYAIHYAFRKYKFLIVLSCYLLILL